MIKWKSRKIWTIYLKTKVWSLPGVWCGLALSVADNPTLSLILSNVTERHHFGLRKKPLNVVLVASSFTLIASPFWFYPVSKHSSLVGGQVSDYLFAGFWLPVCESLFVGQIFWLESYASVYLGLFQRITLLCGPTNATSGCLRIPISFIDIFLGALTSSYSLLTDCCLSLFSFQAFFPSPFSLPSLIYSRFLREAIIYIYISNYFSQKTSIFFLPFTSLFSWSIEIPALFSVYIPSSIPTLSRPPYTRTYNYIYIFLSQTTYIFSSKSPPT